MKLSGVWVALGAGVGVSATFGVATHPMGEWLTMGVS